MRVYFELMPYTNLGNWMFQYAAAKSIGCDVACYSKIPGVRDRLRECEWFKDVEVVGQLPERCNLVTERADIRYQAIEIPPEADAVLLRGFFQSEKYFDAKTVREVFKFDDKAIEKVSAAYDAALSAPNVTAISVRRGDYMFNQHAHPFVGRKFFRDCLSRLPETQDYIVCSDDIAWCKRYFPADFPEKRFTFSCHVTRWDDLILPMLCKNNIISNSSYSWWGAWLNPSKTKRVLAPSQWFGYQYMRMGLDWRDIYFDGVEVVNNDYDSWRLFLGHVCENRLRVKKFLLPAYRLACRMLPCLGRTE